MSWAPSAFGQQLCERVACQKARKSKKVKNRGQVGKTVVVSAEPSQRAFQLGLTLLLALSASSLSKWRSFFGAQRL